MERTANIFSRSLLACIIAAAAVIGYFYAALPAVITVDNSACSFSAAAEASSTAFSAAELRESGGTYSYYVGALPIKEAAAVPAKRPMLVPCGTPFGIKLKAEGVMVVAVRDGSPAAEAGLKKGDVILGINGEDICTDEELSAALLPENTIRLRRGDSELCLDCAACGSGDGGRKIGAWVRDSAAGIGTLTFYDPESGKFGGLGHSVSDATTGETVPLLSGEITSADIYDIVRGSEGEAGELCGALLPDSVKGQLSANTSVGVFGELNETPCGSAIPAAFRQEVKTGSAYILTTVSGTTPKKYSIEIERINLLGLGGSKSMLIRITDPELIEQTGGIVRGMSGSPIIQDGKLVGAVTHVLVNDPERGYAVFAQSMLEEMGLLG